MNTRECSTAVHLTYCHSQFEDKTNQSIPTQVRIRYPILIMTRLCTVLVLITVTVTTKNNMNLTTSRLSGRPTSLMRQNYKLLNFPLLRNFAKNSNSEKLKI